MSTLPDQEASDVPVSEERITKCVNSAQRWSQVLPRFADNCQRKADTWAIIAGVLAAITGMAIFPVLGEDSGVAAKAIVSAFALASSISALIPRVKRYGEQAGAARVLAASYGSVYGRLLDLDQESDINQAAAKTLVAEFQAIKEKKDALSGVATWAKDRALPAVAQGGS